MNWKTRKIDWEKEYFTPNHPHRILLMQAIGQFAFGSVLEVGCGAGANLALLKHFWPQVQLAGVDINEDAIKTAKKIMGNRAVLDVAHAQDIFHSDKSVDITLTDACLMYVNPFKIGKVLEEIKRLTRKHVVFCEFHSKKKFISKYYIYDYKKLLEKHGFYDVQLTKITSKHWPSKSWQKWGYIITASV